MMPPKRGGTAVGPWLTLNLSLVSPPGRRLNLSRYFPQPGARNARAVSSQPNLVFLIRLRFLVRHWPPAGRLTIAIIRSDLAVDRIVHIGDVKILLSLAIGGINDEVAVRSEIRILVIAHIFGETLHTRSIG